MCGCKALALIWLPHTTTSKSRAPQTSSLSPLVDAEPDHEHARDHPVQGHGSRHVRMRGFYATRRRILDGEEPKSVSLRNPFHNVFNVVKGPSLTRCRIYTRIDSTTTRRGYNEGSTDSSPRDERGFLDRA